MTTFISYSRANSDFAVRLAKDLKAAGHDIWLDQLDIPKGARWDDELEKALRTCSTFLIILSPDSIASQNVKDEIGYAIDSGKRILPVMIKQCDVPFRMRRFQYIDFTKEDFDDYDERFEEINDLLSNTSKIQTAKEVGEGPAQAPKPETSKTPAKRRLPLPLLLGGAAVVLVIIIAVVVMSGRDGPASTAPAETEAPAVAENTSPAESTIPPEESTPLPEPTFTPEPQPFFTEEFEGDINDWSQFATSGDERKLDVRAEEGAMVFELSDSVSDLFAYSIFEKFTYTDVKMEVVARNRGVNENNISLICRYSEGSWYEFNIANDGTYTIFAHTPIVTYDPLADGGSRAINSGTSTNKYTVACEGNTLTLWINDVEVRTIPVTRYNFDKGNIGLSVSSYRILPVKVEFESLTISEP